VNNVGDVLPSSVFSLFVAGGLVPQEGGGLVAPGLQGLKVPLVPTYK